MVGLRTGNRAVWPRNIYRASVPWMSHKDDELVPQSPATWENKVVGKAKEVIGRALGDKELVEEGSEQDEIAHEVREEYREEHEH